MRKNIMIKYPSSEYMFVGDTNGDYKAALEAEIPFVYAKYGYGNNSCVEGKVINSLKDLKKFL
ncbi:hypothetical protein [Mediterraneibacter faecis]|uniref:hypothetical protein n=1 Tax=Mediterraneibacter faecis TaxID=592978 RepID=UPI001D085A64|nr:hypothetical protein [Mediterraneibacter faecis]MCB5920264.1 hypothetical protein [Lachnospiraceae bacterium 210521-DFI.1.105]MCB6444802.1 hypothetical protein [Mediterraneibacter faecis]MCQ5257019.1 hypothetical protein [Mediterraneibacter faecis]MCQ5259871.1 hypothetical protein [Mediterraneibacter faecis]MEE0633946.1 hypothetical protein [Mediterraneibacter faecis]